MKSLQDLQALKNSKDITLDLSSTLEAALKQVLAKHQERQWKIENRTAVKAYNDFVEEHRCFSDDYRNF